MEALTVTLETNAPEATFALGVQLGEVLAPRDFVGLEGQLGAGKTSFARGVAQGAGVPLDDVSSPTYSIVQTYQGRITLHHADLYRLGSEADLFGVGYFDLLETEGVMLVEWLSQVREAKPDDALVIGIEVLGPERRRFSLTASGARSAALQARFLARRRS